jgi:hypothetical protein
MDGGIYQQHPRDLGASLVERSKADQDEEGQITGHWPSPVRASRGRCVWGGETMRVRKQRGATSSDVYCPADGWEWPW